MIPLAGRGAMRGPLGASPVSLTNALVYDTFSGVDGVNLTAHAPDIDTVGGGWLAYIGTIALLSNKAAPANAMFRHTYGINAGVADCIISSDLTYDSAADRAAAIVTRLSNANNLWVMTLYVNNIYLMDKNAGVFTTRAIVAKPMVNGTTYTCTLTVNGTSIVGNVGGTAISFVSAFNQAATRHGLELVTLGGTRGNLRADNFTVI